MAKKSKSRQSSDDCLICRKHTGGATTPGGAIYSDPLIYAGHASFPADETVTYPGILVIEPRRHVPGPEDLTDDEAVAIGLQIARLSRALKARTDAEHIYIFRLGSWYHATQGRLASIGECASTNGLRDLALMRKRSKLFAKGCAPSCRTRFEMSAHISIM
jgi:hypothetical protein